MHFDIRLTFTRVLEKFRHLILALLTGVLLSAAWPQGGFAPLLFIAFVPLLWVEDSISAKGYSYSGIRLFPYSYTAFLTWNLLTTWWIWHSTVFGAVMAISVNALLQTAVFQLFHFTKKHTGKVQGYLAFIVFFIAWEYFHLYWDLSWTWLNIGNGFSEYYKWVQWYQYTGVFGGAVWIFVSNIILFLILKEAKNDRQEMRKIKLKLIFIFFWIVTPIAVSYIIYFRYEEKINPVNIVVVQPNIDPYNEKFDGMTASEQLEKMLALAEEKIDSATDYLIGPETALVEGIWENKIEDSYSIQRIRQFLATYPKLKFVLGLSSYRMYQEGEKPSATARPWRRNPKMFWDAYNTGMQVENGQPIQLYHKSKLVPGVEKMPFPSVLKPLEKFAIDLGGMSGSHGVQAERSVFISATDEKKVAPAICYESIYGEYCGEYIHKGAGLIFIITNDGWWKDTPGYRQHLSYARLRAIEHRKSIARSANTGTSCFINQRGDMEQATDFWVPAVIKATLNYNDEQTFYTRYGDYIARVSCFLSVALLLWVVANRLNKNRKKFGR